MKYEQSAKSDPFGTPQEMSPKSIVHPVIIVGAGPIGLTLALTLQKTGVDCVLIEDDHQVCEGSRAIGMSRRTLEIWDALGAVDEIIEKGLDWKGGRSFYKDQEILNFEMADDPRVMYRPMFNIQQSYTEQFLVNQVNQSPHIDLRWQSKLLALKRQGSVMELSIDTPNGVYQASSQYVVACDGAKSSVRSLLGLNLNGTSYEATYIIVDIKLKTDSIIERRCWFDSPSNPGLTVLMHGQPDGIWRLDYQLGESEDLTQALKLENIHLKIKAHLDFIGERGAWELVWFSPYKVHSRALDTFNHGRVLFAGDAAHLMPIFGIRGLNSGVEDAWNLGWKLSSVILGQSPESLLDAYSLERKRVFLENAALANRNALFMTPPNSGIRVLRDAVLSLALGATDVEDILNPKQATYVPLRDSPLSTPEAEHWDGGPKVGEVIPDVLLIKSHNANDTHLQKLVKLKTCGFYFLAHEMDKRALSDLAILRTFENIDLIVISKAPVSVQHVVQVTHPDLHQIFSAEDGGFYLIRPDHHIAGRWKKLDAAIVENALQKLMGFALQGKTLGHFESIDVPYTVPEQIYRLLGNAMDCIDDKNKMLMLMKLCLIQSLEHASVEKFELDLEVALKNIV
jgi:3-(3-hydroxy-phenyl)propionate hydroxylase